MRMPPFTTLAGNVLPSIRHERIDAGRPWRAGRVRALRECIDDARAVLAFLQAGLRARSIDPGQVLWVIDLAPGDGERAWRVLAELANASLRGPAIRYLAACRGQAHHARLAADPCLAPLIAGGALYLDRDGDALPLHPIRNPPVVLAHEALSSLGQGLHVLRAGQWLEAGDDGAWRPVPRDAGWAHLLSAYRAAPEGTLFTLPLGAMRVLSGLLRASEGRLLLRASDAGSHARADWQDAGIVADGLRARRQVNFEALARWHRALGGHVHQSMHEPSGRVLHWALHAPEDSRLRECLPELLAIPHPDEHVDLLHALATLATPAPEHRRALVRATGDDPRAFALLARQGVDDAGAMTLPDDGWWSMHRRSSRSASHRRRIDPP